MQMNTILQYNTSLSGVSIFMHRKQGSKPDVVSELMRWFSLATRLEGGLSNI